jgi:hypothetical protein
MALPDAKFIDPKLPWLGQILQPQARKCELDVKVEVARHSSMAADGWMLAFRIRDQGREDNLAVFPVRLKAFYKYLADGLPAIAEKLGGTAGLRQEEGYISMWHELAPLTVANLLEHTAELGVDAATAQMRIVNGTPTKVDGPVTKRVVVHIVLKPQFHNQDLKNA